MLKKNLQLDKILELIGNNNLLIFIEDLCAELGVTRQTLYNYFPVGGDEHGRIMEALYRNKSKIKLAMRKKWIVGNNPTTDIALYKLCATQEEREILDTRSVELSTREAKEIALKIE